MKITICRFGRERIYVQFYPPAPRARYGNALSAVVALAEIGGKYVGITNTPTDTLERLVADANGRYVVASNQVSYSVVDRRAADSGLLDACARHGVAVIAYAPLAGGLLADKWLGAAEPKDWSAAGAPYYKPFDRRCGYLGLVKKCYSPEWPDFQALLLSLRAVADKHSVDIAAVAARYPLDTVPNSAVVVGVRGSGGPEFAAATARVLRFTLDADDLANIAAAGDARVSRPAVDPGGVYDQERTAASLQRLTPFVPLVLAAVAGAASG